MIKKIIQYIKLNSWQLVVLIVCACISLSLAFNTSIGIDERFSMDWSVWPMPDFWNRIKLDVCPTYLIMLRPVLKATNNSLLAGKLFSWVMFVICLLIGYIFVRKEFGEKSFYVYSTFITGTPLIMEKSVEVRMYAISYALILLSAVLAYRIICKETKKWHWWAFVIIGLLTAYTHYFSLLSLVLLYAMLFMWLIIERDWQKFRNMIFCSLAMCLGYGPWLKVIFAQTNSETTSWIPPTTSRLGPIRDVFVSYGIDIKMFMMGVVILLTVYAIYKLARVRDAGIFWASGCMAIPWILMIFGEVLEMFFRPILVDRYMTIPFCLFILGVAYLAKDLKKYVAVVLCVIFMASCLITYPGLHENLYVTYSTQNIEE